MPKLFFYSSFCLMTLYGCSKTPAEMAKEYCACRADVETGKKNESTCLEMAESHALQLQDNDKAIADYTNKILDCMGYREIKTSK